MNRSLRESNFPGLYPDLFYTVSGIFTRMIEELTILVARCV